MGEAILTRRGGGNKKTEYFAVISVTYAEGATLICTDGTTILQAKDADGKYTFIIPSEGTWTVTASNGSNTKSVDVSITTKGQYESVELLFKRMLYAAGDADTGFIAIGWKFHSAATAKAPTISYGDDSVVFTATTNNWGGYSGVAYFPQKIDLTPYSALIADATLAGSINAGNRPEGLYIWSEISTGVVYPNAAVASALFNGVGTKELSIDISSLSGEYYIGFGLRYESTPAENITLREAYLE